MDSIFFKKYVLNFSIFSSRMGFRILSVFFIGVGVGRANSMFGGICSVISEWSEFRLWSLLVVDVYRVSSGDLI